MSRNDGLIFGYTLGKTQSKKQISIMSPEFFNFGYSGPLFSLDTHKKGGNVAR
jgi:hypothetical protein